jgi:polyhydroxybutyrate depolymerase
MRTRALILGILLVIFSASLLLKAGKPFDLDLSALQPATLQMLTLEHDNISRVYGLYIPQSAIAGSAPLLFLLHGGGGAAEQVFGTEFGRNWQTLADRDGFIIIVPQGREDIGFPADHHWNDCRTGIENPDVATDLDDVGFITSLIDLADERFGIDRTRVYITGASNGGMMSLRIAFEASDQFAAIGAVIANIPDPSDCTLPTNPISVLIMNGTADPLIPDEGGCVANPACRRGSVVSTVESVKFWVQFNATSTTPLIENLPDVVTTDGSTITTSRYANGLDGTEVMLYHVIGGGHNVPGNEPVGPARRAEVGAKNRDINGAEEIWDFFQQHSR